MSPSRRLAAIAAGAVVLYVLYDYVPLSARHTMEIVSFKPLGSWSIESPSGLSIFYASILAGLFALYGLGWRETESAKDEEAARRVIYAGAAAAAIVLVFSSSLLSKDVFDYVGQGRILSIHRANPFTRAATEFPDDPFLRQMGWPQFTSLYGPGWVSASGILAWIAGGSVEDSVLAFRSFFMAVHLVNGFLIGALLRGWGAPSLAGELLYLWNPLVLIQSIAQAHNDAFLMLWVLLGLLFFQRRPRGGSLSDEVFGAVCMTVSVLVKYVTAPIVLFSLAALRRERDGAAGWTRAALLAAIAAAVFVIGYMPYASGMDLLHFLRPYQHGSYQGSALMVLDMILEKAMGPGIAALAMKGSVMRFTGAILAAGLAASTIVLLLRIRDLDQVPSSSLIVLFTYLLAVTALLRLSYGVWLVALAALPVGEVLRRAALLFSGSLFALDIYWVYAIRSPGGAADLHRERAMATLVALAVPSLYLLARRVRGRRSPIAEAGRIGYQGGR
jgi:hypothetical protein